jgi:Uncharacterized protein conserved in bacteria (DUF2334)
MYFCIRDDDTSFFTTAEELDNAYAEITRRGPVSLAVIPFCRAGFSKGVPEKFRGRWSTHPLHENRPLVQYLRAGISQGRFEIMLHGYGHDEPNGRGEFLKGRDLVAKVTEGRKYLQELLDTKIRVFVAPKNTIGKDGLRAIARAGLHFGGTAGIRCGWPVFSPATWRTWLKLRKWQNRFGAGIPWILDLSDHREIPGTAITPSSSFETNKSIFSCALEVNGVFCAATHYWELPVESSLDGDPSVGTHLQYLVDLARKNPQVIWASVGDVITNGPLLC